MHASLPAACDFWARTELDWIGFELNWIDGESITGNRRWSIRGNADSGTPLGGRGREETQRGKAAQEEHAVSRVPALVQWSNR
jgi:hypothetical protein